MENGQKRVPLKDWVINRGTRLDLDFFSGGQMDRNTQAISKQIICRDLKKKNLSRSVSGLYDLFSFIFSEVI